MDEKLFCQLLQEPLKKMTKLEKDVGFTETDDLSKMFRLLGILGVWEWTYKR